MITLDESANLVAKLLERQHIVAFCGAGISRNSGIPLANEVMRSIVQALGASKEELDIVLGSGPQFERFMEVLDSYCDITPLLDIFASGTPNSQHTFLAKLAKAAFISTICTTNFDQMLERALELQGFVSTKDFRVHYAEEDFGRIDWEGQATRVIKLHGSVDDPNSIDATLRSVAQNLLSVGRRQAIKGLFSLKVHSGVIVLGYSCSDRFDIVPAIERVHRSSCNPVLFIEHSSGANMHEPDAPRENAFCALPGSQRITCNTDRLIEALWRHFFPAELYQAMRSVADMPRRQNKVADWLNQIPRKDCELVKNGILGQLLVLSRACSNPVETPHCVLDRNKAAVKCAKGRGTNTNIVRAYLSLGYAYESLSDLPSARFSYVDAMNAAETPEAKCAALNLLGSVYLMQNEARRAQECFNQSFTEAKSISHETFRWDELGKSLVGMARVLAPDERYKSAFLTYQKGIIALLLAGSPYERQESVEHLLNITSSSGFVGLDGSSAGLRWCGVTSKYGPAESIITVDESRCIQELQGFLVTFPEAPFTANPQIIADLAWLISLGCSEATAYKILSDALVGIIANLGDKEPTVLMFMNNFAARLVEMGHLDSARQMYEKALGAHQKALGLYHPHTGIAAWGLFQVLGQLNRVEQATGLLETYQNTFRMFGWRG